MMRHSIRWRLSLSFAAIALLAIVALGAVLLITLRGYYAQRELDYLRSNAKFISADLGIMVRSELSADELQGQIENLAFLTQTRVRWLDENGKALQDSGVPTKTTLALGTIKGAGYTQTLDTKTPSSDYVGVFSSGPIVTDTVVQIVTQTVTMTEDGVVQEKSVAKPHTVISFRSIPVVGTPYGFGLDTTVVSDGRRSDQVVRQPFYDTAGKLQGYVELSEGPSYGRDILDSVARGWAVAGAVAVLLATIAGWLISRRLSAPLMVLTGVTQRMATGDLAARAPISGRDELGLLGRSFNEMAGQIEATIVALRRFVSDAAHQIHTPLTALRTNLELASGGEIDARQRLLLDRAQGQVARLERLADELLQLSRIESAVMDDERRPIDLAALIRSLAESQAARAEQLGLDFALDIPIRAVMLEGNTEQLRGLVENLADNALKFTPAGGSVTVNLHQVDGWAELSVTDTGIGIPAEDLPQLFSRFHRGRNAAACAGSGLGLAIVKATAEHHGGQVTAQNTDHGARFTVRFRLSAFPNP